MKRKFSLRYAIARNKFLFKKNGETTCLFQPWTDFTYVKLSYPGEERQYKEARLPLADVFYSSFMRPNDIINPCWVVHGHRYRRLIETK